MKLSYYPGCSLDSTAIEYNESLKYAAGVLGLELQDLPDWTCCGASSGHVTGDKLAVSLAGRNLLIADKMDMDLMVPCAACFHRLKVADKALKAGQSVQGLDQKYQGKFNIKYAADVFRGTVGEKALAAKIKKPLAGLQPVCYYGCLTVRPPKITDAPDTEDPMAMDEIMQTLGAEVKNWSYKADCCGGNIMFTHPDLAKKMVKKLFDMALEAGANCIVAGCPICQSNLDTRQNEILNENGHPYNMPVYYFTELMALAYGDPHIEKYLNKHLTDAKTLLRQKGLI
jgi:heterodisulfide reductase subunit B2